MFIDEFHLNQFFMNHIKIPNLKYYLNIFFINSTVKNGIANVNKKCNFLT